MKKNKELITTTYLIATLILLFIGTIFIYFQVILFQDYMYIFYGLSLISIPIMFINKIRFKDIYPICIFLLVLYLSSLFSGDFNQSLFGFSGRYEGLLSFISYALLFMCATSIKNEKYKKYVINTIFCVGIGNILFATLQNFRIIEYNHLYPKSLLGNSNSYATLCLMSSILALGMFLYNKKKIYLILFIAFVYGLLLSGSMGCLLAFIITLVIWFIYNLCIKKIKISKRSIKISLAVISIILIFYFILNLGNNNHLTRDIIEYKNDFINLLSGQVSDRLGNNRFQIWKGVLAITPQYLLHGTGVDRLAYALNEVGFVLNTGELVDKAHCEYLQLLVTGGIFALASYIYFLIIALIKSFRNAKNNKLFLAIFFTIIAYLLQAFVGISVTRVAYIFYIIMGLGYNKGNEG